MKRTRGRYRYRYRRCPPPGGVLSQKGGFLGQKWEFEAQNVFFAIFRTPRIKKWKIQKIAGWKAKGGRQAVGGGTMPLFFIKYSLFIIIYYYLLFINY